METKISMKKVWVSSDGWRGRFTLVNAVAGSADTGSWDDSPCPSKLVKAELNEVKKALKKAGINYRSGRAPSSNLFCIHRYIVVAEDNVERGKEVVQEWLDSTENEFVYIP
jgi:hypothetical protein